MVVWMSDQGRRQILDEYLWTYQELAFVPHVVWEPGLGVAGSSGSGKGALTSGAPAARAPAQEEVGLDDPVVLLGSPANPNQAEVLVVGDELPPEQWVSGFAEVHDLIPEGEPGEGRRRFWSAFQQEQG